MKVSVIIPSFNRFKFLMNAIDSIKKQTYKNIEIIVVNDCSTEKEYYDYDWKDVKIIHLIKNSKQIFGFANIGYVRNCGIEIAEGDYIAFCDDDDIWFPKKIELQLQAMRETKTKMSSTDGLIGRGQYANNVKYPRYNAEYHYETLKKIYARKNIELGEFPDVWNLDFLKVHNCVICSSVIIEKTILEKIEGFRNIKPPGEDYDCWLRAIVHTELVYVKEPCFYYDAGHGYGQNY